MASHSTLDDDDEDLLQQLSKEELEQLSEIIDPDVRIVVGTSVLYSTHIIMVWCMLMTKQ